MNFIYQRDCSVLNIWVEAIKGPLHSIRETTTNFFVFWWIWSVFACIGDMTCVVFSRLSSGVWHWGGDVGCLSHWGRVTHIRVSDLTIISSDNGLSPGRRQAIIRTNAGILLIRPWGTNFSEMLIEIHTFSFKKIHLKMSSGKWRPFCLGLNVLMAAESALRWSCRGLGGLPYVACVWRHPWTRPQQYSVGDYFTL